MKPCRERQIKIERESARDLKQWNSSTFVSIEGSHTDTQTHTHTHAHTYPSTRTRTHTCTHKHIHHLQPFLFNVLDPCGSERGTRPRLVPTLRPQTGGAHKLSTCHQTDTSAGIWQKHGFQLVVAADKNKHCQAAKLQYIDKEKYAFLTYGLIAAFDIYNVFCCCHITELRSTVVSSFSNASLHVLVSSFWNWNACK